MRYTDFDEDEPAPSAEHTKEALYQAWPYFVLVIAFMALVVYAFY